MKLEFELEKGGNATLDAPTGKLTHQDVDSMIACCELFRQMVKGKRPETETSFPAGARNGQAIDG